MQTLIKYIKSHKRYILSSVKKYYLSDTVKSILVKYNLTLHELCYRIKKDIPLDKVFICKNCGKKIVFNYSRQYREFCSQKCANIFTGKYEERKDKIKQTCLKKYGIDSYSKTQECKNKAKQACLDKYGVDSYAKTQEYKDAMKVQKDEIRKKKKQTCINKYGTNSPFGSTEIQNKIHQTILQKYGVTSYSKTQEFKDRTKQTCLEKYSVDSYAKTQECKDKMKQTCLDKYNVDSYSKTQEFKDKMKQTCISKYGTDNYAKSQEFKGRQGEIQEKIKQTSINKYGFNNYSKTKECQQKIYNTKKKNNSFNTSEPEEKVYDLLLTKFKQEDIIRQYKSELYPFNCDFYIKSLDLYIEYNGMYTHGYTPQGKCLGSYDKNNKEHLELLELWKSNNTKFYRSAIKTWTVTDVKKLECFKNNNLNYKIFWNIEEVKEWLGGCSLC